MSALRWSDHSARWPLAEHSRFVEAAGLRWHVQMLGSGPAALLIHGTGASAHSWRDVVPLLADRFTVIAVDLPGHAFAQGRPRAGLTLPGMARSLAGLCAVLDVRPAVVAGHSAGAAIAVRMALDGATDAPIVGFGPALQPFPGFAGPIFSATAGLLLANPFAAHILSALAHSDDAVGRFLGKNTGSRVGAKSVRLYRTLFSNPGHCQGVMAMMAGWDLNAFARDLPGLAAPLHIVHGSRDRTIPEDSVRAAARAVRDGRLKIVPGLGHLLHEEQPEMAAAAIASAYLGSAAAVAAQ